MGGGFQVSIRIYFHTLSKPKLRLFKVGNLLRPKGDAGIKKSRFSQTVQAINLLKNLWV